MKHRRPSRKVPECQHIKTNGLRCQSPAICEHRYCFFHQRSHDLRRLRLRHPNAKIQLPLLEDAESIQVAIQEVADAITQDRIDPRRAGLLLFALQTASSNLKHADFEPRKLREYSDPNEMSPVAKFIIDALELNPPNFYDDPDRRSDDEKKSPASATEERAAVATG